LDELDLRLLELIDAQYTRRPFYGSRRLVVYLQEQGQVVNRKCVQRLMRVLGLAGMAPGPATSKAHPRHQIYPYLRRGVAVTRPNQVWSTDITYIRLAHGFAYLVAVIDGYSRRVLSWRLSNTLAAAFCVDGLEDALRTHGRPEIFNTDQGSPFTSDAFTGVLLDAVIAISMDGRGRALDNIFVERLWRSVKHEDVYLKGYATLPELLLGLTEYFAFYNSERPHQALDNRTPDAVYHSGEGGGASIADHGGDPPDPLQAIAEGVQAALVATPCGQSVNVASDRVGKMGATRPPAPSPRLAHTHSPFAHTAPHGHRCGLRTPAAQPQQFL
jgi:putative transposase